uniref:Immunoglobulin domain-containing protein n=1 Tax=Scleropages formosus TaxID=113540 RepID=A0A8C9VNR9_SCLFO
FFPSYLYTAVFAGAGNVPQNTGRWLTLQKGESVTIPCFYHPWYKNYVKQWCSGLEIFSCTVMASTDSPQVHRVSITDDPTQGVFTVTMNNVQESDSGTYWCLGKYGDRQFPVHISVTQKRQTPINPTSLTEKQPSTAVTTDTPSASAMFVSNSSESEDYRRKTKRYFIGISLHYSFYFIHITLFITLSQLQQQFNCKCWREDDYGQSE